MSNEAPTDALRLEPCPFCGGDVINTRSQEMTKGPAYYWHKCETCGAEAEGDYGEDVAVAAWNRRAAPASPLPGGGWKPSRNDVARRCDPKAWEFYDRHIDNPIMGAECRAEVAASIRMADAILALPVAPTGEPK